MGKRHDENYGRESGSLHRVVLRLMRGHINRVVKYVLSRAYERGQIDSHTMHEMAGCCDRVLWPERTANQISREIEKHKKLKSLFPRLNASEQQP